jgi:alkanesulfonate monooxygenase SsuD/methylene tetrahydromethanopterin reductase-like flavin-dependent oxidoreductase (luciferase family)
MSQSETRVWKFVINGRGQLPSRTFTAGLSAAIQQAPRQHAPRHLGFCLRSGPQSPLMEAVRAERDGFTVMLAPYAARGGLRTVAEHTQRLRLGLQVTGIEDPVQLARELHRVAERAPGRVLLCLTATEEKEANERLLESIHLVRWLWSGQTVNFHGRFWNVRDARLPAVSAGPLRVMLSAYGHRGARLAGQYADGWITRPDQLAGVARKAFEEGVRSAGRPLGELEVMVENVEVPDLRHWQAQSSLLEPLYQAGATTLLLRASRALPSPSQAARRTARKLKG